MKNLLPVLKNALSTKYRQLVAMRWILQNRIIFQKKDYLKFYYSFKEKTIGIMGLVFELAGLKTLKD